MNDLIPGCTIKGSIFYHGGEITGKSTDVVDLRKKIGMVFQQPNPFPKSIYENVIYGPKVHGKRTMLFVFISSGNWICRFLEPVCPTPAISRSPRHYGKTLSGL